MLAGLISFTISTAVLLFVIGLVLQGDGARLRRGAIALFLLALLPSVAVGLTRALLASLGASFSVNPLGSVLVIAILCIGAYVGVRLLGAPDQKPPTRIQMKRPYTHRRDTDFIEFLRREIDRDA